MATINRAQKKANKEIAELDDSLKLMSEHLKTCSEKDTKRYMVIVNRLLDERLICMEARDKKPEAKAVTPKKKATKKSV